MLSVAALRDLVHLGFRLKTNTVSQGQRNLNVETDESLIGCFPLQIGKSSVSATEWEGLGGVSSYPICNSSYKLKLPDFPTHVKW